MRKESVVWRITMFLLGIVVLWSLFWGLYSLVKGHGEYGTSNVIPWGLLIAAYAFFVSSIGCCFVGSLESVFGIKKYEAVAKRAILLAIVIVLVGMAIIFVELGHPFRIFLGYITSPNFTAPIWWMGVNYTLYLFFICLEYWAMGKDNHKLVKTMGILAFLAAVVAHSTVGAVFGLLQSRPFLYGPYMPLDFVLSAWVIGFAVMLIVLYVSIDYDNEKNLSESMRKWLAVCIGITIFFTFWKVMTGLHSNEEAKLLATKALIDGSLSIKFWVFEVVIGLIIPILLLMNRSSATKTGLILASAMAIIGRLFSKINMVEAGQIVPLKAIEYDKVIYQKYTASFIEISILVGAIAFILLFYSLADKYYFNGNILSRTLTSKQALNLNK